MRNLIYLLPFITFPLFAVQVSNLFDKDTSLCADGGEMANCEGGTTLVFDQEGNCNCLDAKSISQAVPSCPSGSTRQILTQYENPANDDYKMVFAGYACVVNILDESNEPVGANVDTSLNELALGFLRVGKFPFEDFDGSTITSVNVKKSTLAEATVYKINATQEINGFLYPVDITLTRSPRTTSSGVAYDHFEISLLE